MYDNYNYPYGADTPDAPWNQPEIPEEDFEITCSQSLSKTSTVTTNNYIPCVEDEPWNGIHEEWADTSKTVWSKEYSESGCYTPLELIEECKELAQWKLEHDETLTISDQDHLKNVIENCEGWGEDETEFVEN